MLVLAFCGQLFCALFLSEVVDSPRSCVCYFFMLGSHLALLFYVQDSPSCALWSGLLLLQLSIAIIMEAAIVLGLLLLVLCAWPSKTFKKVM